MKTKPSCTSAMSLMGSQAASAAGESNSNLIRAWPLFSLLSSVANNNQVDAIKRFLALYDVTQRDVQINGVLQDTGSWESIGLANEVRNADGTLARNPDGTLKNTVREALFRAGTKDGGLISSVLIGGGNLRRDGTVDLIANQNPLHNVRAVLTRLGVDASPYDSHHHHFHIYLRPPEVQPIVKSANLQTSGPGREPLLTATSGDTSMLDFLALNLQLPLSDTNTAMYVATAVVQQKAVERPFDMVLASCEGLRASSDDSLAFAPAGTVKLYLQQRAGKAVGIDFTKAKVTVISQPKHGGVIDLNEMETRVPYSMGPIFRYVPTSAYRGDDTIVFAVEVDGKRYKVSSLIKVMEQFGEDATFCAGSTFYIKRVGSLEGLGGTIEDWSQQSKMSDLLSLASNVTYSFSTLPGSSVGTTTGEGLTAQITLDTTAAGHGWYVDATPLDNTDDYLPTSDANVWQAKAGSAAEGKMDMLSVLLHEYGHALGLDHSDDSGDYMAATLQAGQRKLPTADELQLMAQLVAQLKASTPTDPTNPTAPNPSLPLGALLIGRLALGRKPEDEGQGSHALYSANPTLQGGNLSTLQDWATQGSVVTRG